MSRYQGLAGFSDWVEEVIGQRRVWPLAAPGEATQARICDVLGSCDRVEMPLEVTTEFTWACDGLECEEVSWWVGYGPRTQGWILKRADVTDPMPAVLALHDHGSFKSLGKEKIADGPHPIPEYVVAYREQCYGGRAYANALAAEGFVVLIHDVFTWGSRCFPLETLPAWLRSTRMTGEKWVNELAPDDVSEYNYLTELHENWLERYCAVLGTTFAGMVCREDRIALNYLRMRPDVLSDRIGCMGLSGGGNRACFLQATYDGLSAAVVVAMMSTYEELLIRSMDHSWLMFPHGWARHGDWPDIAACRAPSPLLVQYDMDDPLFTIQGMRDADKRLGSHYESVGHPEAYEGQFYPGPHKFDLEMQEAAFKWLKDWLVR